jgi:hypothetical protein
VTSESTDISVARIRLQTVSQKKCENQSVFDISDGEHENEEINDKQSDSDSNNSDKNESEN